MESDVLRANRKRNYDRETRGSHVSSSCLFVCNRIRYMTRYLTMIAVITVADNFSNEFVFVLFSSGFPVVCHHDMDEETERKKRKMMKCEEWEKEQLSTSPFPLSITRLEQDIDDKTVNRRTRTLEANRKSGQRIMVCECMFLFLVSLPLFTQTQSFYDHLSAN